MVERVIIRSGVVDGFEEFEHVRGSGLVLGGFGAVGFRGIGGVEVIVVGGVLFVFVVGEPLEVLQLLMKILHRVTSINWLNPLLSLTIPSFFQLLLA